jgi:hypothetical protein
VRHGHGHGQNAPLNTAATANIVTNITAIAWSFGGTDSNNSGIGGADSNNSGIGGTGNSNDKNDIALNKTRSRSRSNDYSEILPLPPLSVPNGNSLGHGHGHGHGLGDENLGLGIGENNSNNLMKDPLQSIISMPEDLLMVDDSLIAAAGSNGVVVIWRTCDILGGGFGNNKSHNFGWRGSGGGGSGGSRSASSGGGGGSGVSKFFGGGNRNNFTNNNKDHFQFLQNYMNHQTGGGGGGGGNNRNRMAESNASSTAIGQPEAVLVEHTRAVNRIAWHRRRPGVFLTASQDATVKMFERREDKTEEDLDNQKRNNESSKWNWFGKSTSSSHVKSYSWHYIGCFKPNCGPIQDIQWSHCNDDLFAMVTSNGFLVVHNAQLVNNGRPMVRIAAHAREATTLDWHPIDPYIIATGSVDKTVKGKILETFKEMKICVS